MSTLPIERELVVTPVAAPWQPACCAARDHLVTALGIPVTEVVVTRIDQHPPGQTATSNDLITIWLLARGRSYRYEWDPGRGLQPES